MLEELFVMFNRAAPVRRPGYLFQSNYEFVAHYGRRFEKVRQLPDGMKLGRPKLCYHNAFTKIGGPYLYTEGYMGFMSIPILHAWLTDIRSMEVIEVTLKEPGQEYFGIIYQTGYVVEMAAKLGYAGILDNEYQIRSLFTEGLPAEALFDPKNGVPA